MADVFPLLDSFENRDIDRFDVDTALAAFVESEYTAIFRIPK